ncbi:DUF930 domain-containing protein [Rhizobium sp. L1K21]|uniref:DUF930 domain-containing protein n=1 Tax=Rhizobium sp. L1K21 TaxID=2954933 RepID=UPI002092F09B|nr:DUF930 domain-containing protein [Rhizobium sp. L1K21]MCO6185819.1 DUF930 domain-containing protein [Rhizobium sp. L1K21]
MNASSRQPVLVLPQSARRLAPDLLVSIFLHLLLLAAALALIPQPEAPGTPPENVVSVNMLPSVPERPFELPPMSAPDVLRTPPKIPLPDAGSRTAPPAQSSQMQAATKLFARDVLQKPINARAVAALATLAEPERVEQLCDVEGMEQIAAADKAFAPDQLVAYAMANTHVEGRALIANGAAFRSGGQWYNFKFRCGLNEDLSEVTSFSFQIGAPIGKELWADHMLTAHDDADDDD